MRDYLYRPYPKTTHAPETYVFAACVFGAYGAKQIELPLPEARDPAGHAAVRELVAGGQLHFLVVLADGALTRPTSRMSFFLPRCPVSLPDELRRWFRYAPPGFPASPLTPAEELLLGELAPLGAVRASQLDLVVAGSLPLASALAREGLLEFERLPDGDSLLRVPPRLALRYGAKVRAA